MKTQLYVAKIGKKFLNIKEEEYDMTGYGGSTTTEYTYKKVSSLSKATVLPKESFNLEHFEEKNKVKFFKVKEQIIRKIIK